MSRRSREYAFLVLAVVPLMGTIHNAVYSASTWVRPKPQYLLYMVCPLAVLGAVGLMTALAPFQRRRAVRSGLMAAAALVFAALIWPAVSDVYRPDKSDTKIDYRGIWAVVQRNTGYGDTLVTIAGSGIAPVTGLWLPFDGQWRYGAQYHGGVSLGQNMAQDPRSLDAMPSGRVVLGATEHPENGLPAPKRVPPSVALTRRPMAWVIWEKNWGIPPQKQLCDLLGIALQDLPPRQNAVYPFVLRALLLEKHEDRAEAVAALQGAFRQCTDAQQVPTLRALAERLMPEVLATFDAGTARDSGRPAQRPAA